MENLLENLNKEQERAVKHTGGPLLIVAGAGTGKTTVITRRIAYLVNKKLAQPDEIAALTFTEKAAGEMQERVDLLLPIGYYDSWISTFHGFCERILKAHGLDIGLPNDFKLLENTQQWIFIYKNFDRFKLKYYKPLGNPSRFVDALLRHFSRCKDELITPEEYLKYAQNFKPTLDQAETNSKRKIKKPANPAKKTAALPPSEIAELDLEEQERLTELAAAYQTYQKLLLDNNYLDFGDLINYTLDLFKKRPKILAHYQNKFKFLMIDEFQDTNVAQYELIKLLAGQRQNLVVVGDDDQSIYKFRGASVSNIIKLQQDFPALKQITLVENYRTSQNILDLAYNFIQSNNPDRLEVKFKINKKLRSNISENGIIEVLEGDDLSHELNFIAKKILELKNDHFSEKISQTKTETPEAAPQTTLNFPDLSAVAVSWNDFAILLRRNATAEQLLPVLASHGIPFTFVANKGLYKKPIIVDILSYLRVLDNVHNSNSLYRTLTLPKFFLEPQELSSLLYFAKRKTCSLHETLEKSAEISDISQEGRIKIRSLLDCIKKHFELANKASAAEVFVHIIKDLGIQEKINEDTLENAENRELIEQLYKKIEEFQQQEADRSLHNFLVNLELELQAGNEGEIKFDPNLGPESVKVMTVHSAKGLEFKNVFIVSLVDQQFPSRAKADPIEIPTPLIKDILPEGDFHLQEERRLFYVAVTRAKTNLYLTWGKDYGGKRTKKPSLFLLETHLVPSEHVSKATGKVVFTRPLAEKIIYQTTPTQFSYSQLNDFETCPLKYKYRHYLKLPVAGSCHLSFGQTIHKVFEEYLGLHKRNLELPQKDLFGAKPETVLPPYQFLEELYEKHWVDDWYDTKLQKDEYRAKGHKMLKIFHETLASRGCNPKYIEKPFYLPLGDYTFKGKIDRADSTASGVEIWDYKTGKAPKKGAKKDLDQLKIYQWAAQEFLNEKVTGIKYWFLDDNSIFEEDVASQEEINSLKSGLLNLIEKIIYVTRHDLFKQEHENCPEHNCDFEDLE